MDWRESVKANKTQRAFMDAVLMERRRQNRKWGRHHFTADALARVLGEEFGEVCRAINDGDKANLAEELVQVAAVCLKYAELGRWVRR